MRLFLTGIALAIVLSLLAIPNSIELQGLGWNLTTFAFAGTLFFGVWGNLALSRQGTMIFRAERAEAVSIQFFLIMSVMFLSQGLYGIEKNSLALVFTSVGRTIFHLPILVGLWKFKKWSLSDKAVGAVAATCATANCFEVGLTKDVFFVVTTIAAIASCVAQPWEIFRLKKSGQVSIGLFAVYLVNVSFWLIYSASSGNHLLFWTTLPYFVLYAATVALIMKYKS